MEDYIGKTCPYCKTIIQKEENIILCSDCGMPHHQECWIENQGCTTFGCLGTIQAVDQGMAQSAMEIPLQFNEEQLKCFKCGLLNHFSNTFCRKCGAKLLKPLGSDGTSHTQLRDNPQHISHTNQGAIQTSMPYKPMGAQTVQPQAPGQPYGSSPLGRHYSSNAGIPINPQTSPQSYQNNTDPLKIESNMPHNAATVSLPGGQLPYGSTSPTGAFTPHNAASASSQASHQSYDNTENHIGSTSSENDFIKVNPDYYRRKFIEMRIENRKFSWNWSAWFFNVIWCFYRKMYKVGLFFTGILLLGLLLPEIEPILNLLTALSLGTLGNSFYMRYTEAALKKAESIPDLQRYTYLRKKGGISISAVGLFFVGLLLVGIMIGVITEFLSYMG